MGDQWNQCIILRYPCNYHSYPLFSSSLPSHTKIERPSLRSTETMGNCSSCIAYAVRFGNGMKQIAYIFVYSSRTMPILLRLRLHLYRIAFRSNVKKHLSAPFRNSIFIGMIATGRCCFSQLLKGVHSVSDIGAFSRCYGRLSGIYS